MRRSSAHVAFRIYLLALMLAISAPACGRAEWTGDRSGDGHRAPVYQRRAFEWTHGNGWHGHGNGRHGTAPPVSAGWFQRPYPYHLDYYRMRYGGSYAPYFGNLYGPPQVVTAPPYYGAYYGGYGYPNGVGNETGYGGPAVDGTNRLRRPGNRANNQRSRTANPCWLRSHNGCDQREELVGD